MRKKSLCVLYGIMMAIVGCNQIQNAESEAFDDIVFGTDIALDTLAQSLTEKAILTDKPLLMQNFASIPKSREELENMKVVVKVFEGNKNAGIKIPGFGGLTLKKNQSNLNIYYLETKVVGAEDQDVYGIGYSAHYLFNKVKKGISISNLAKVAASAELQRGKTSVFYSLQSYGIRSGALSKFFKPTVNRDFDVEGFGLIQSSLDGIHNVLSDSTLSSKTKFTPVKMSFIAPEDLSL